MLQLKGLDTQAKEITIDSNGVSENGYRVDFNDPHPEALILFNRVAEQFPECLTHPYPDLRDWELIGLTKTNGQNYLEDTISVTPQHRPSPELLDHLGDGSVRPEELEHFYSFKCLLESNRVVLKVYDTVFSRHPLPALPPGVELEQQFGVGVHLNYPPLADFRDIYFLTRLDPQVIAAHFNVPVLDLHQPPNSLKCYGCLFNARTGAIVKIKQYFFPDNLELINI